LTLELLGGAGQRLDTRNVRVCIADRAGLSAALSRRPVVVEVCCIGDHSLRCDTLQLNIVVRGRSGIVQGAVVQRQVSWDPISTVLEVQGHEGEGGIGLAVDDPARAHAVVV
jgi:hypothetical protein